jgi:AI-2 transport protein TqsA
MTILLPEDLMGMKKLAEYSVIFIALVLLAIVLKTFQSPLRALAIATLLTFFVMPLTRFSKKKNIPVPLTFLSIFLVLGLLVVSVGYTIKKETSRLTRGISAGNVDESADKLLKLMEKFGIKEEDITAEKISEWTRKGIMKGAGIAKDIFSESLAVVLLLLFVVNSYPALFRSIEKKYGKSESQRLEATFRKIEGDMAVYLVTKSVMSLLTAFATAGVLYLFTAKYIIISSIVTFTLNFIPLIGSIAAVILVVILYLITYGITLKALWLFMSLMIVQIAVGSVLEPKVAGERLSISPIIIILSLSLWGWIWGIIGMLISVPLIIFIFILITHVSDYKVEAA